MATPDAQPFLRRVGIKNFRSIGSCDVALGPLVALVGRNGSGKSNFLDALRFVADSLNTTLDHALRERGGLGVVRRHSTGHPRNFAIRLDVCLPDRQSATYRFEIAGRSSGGFVVRREQLILSRGAIVTARYELREGELRPGAIGGPFPVPASDRLFLVSASGLPDIRPVYEALRSMGFYNLNPEVIKRPQSPDAGEMLHRDGANISSVVARLREDAPREFERAGQYLRRIVPGISDFARVELGPQETIEFRQEVDGSEFPWKFYAMNMSDGTLRALGILMAVAQLASAGRHVPLVGIEEPETALHPAAAGALIDALREASQTTQVIITTHSADLVDHLDPADDCILVVQASKGTTEVGQIDTASREAIRSHLYTAGELLRIDQLAPDPADTDRQQSLDLFREEQVAE